MPKLKSARWKWLVRVFQVLLLVAVAWGIWTCIHNALNELDEYSLSWKDFHPGWLALSGFFYLMGMLPAGLFWHRILHEVNERPRLIETLRAYYIGHLGKYVPGKAMVIVMRAGLLSGAGVNKTTAAVTIFMETLTQMTVGAAFAAAVIAVRYSQHWQLLVLALSLMFCAGLPTVPGIFRGLVRWLQVAQLNPEIEEKLNGITFRLVGIGWLYNLAGWLVLGLSLWAVLHAVPTKTTAIGNDVETLLLLSATSALAIVSGFLSLIPGGLGVRELVMMSLMTHELQLGAVLPVVASIIIRLVWLGAELVAAAAGALVARRSVSPAETPDR